MSRETKLFDDTHHRLTDLSDIARHLTDLSRAFFLTGNQRVADDLLQISNEIEEHSKTIRGNLAEALNIQVTNAQASSKAMLAAALLGVES